MFTEFNVEKIIKITVSDYEESDEYCYKPEKRFLGIVIQKAGIYYSLRIFKDEFCSEGMPENHFLKDDIIYEKPHCTIYTNSDRRKRWHFESVDEAWQREKIIKGMTKSKFID